MPKPPTANTPGFQLHDWNHAVELLGGKHAAARALPCNERTMRALCNGERALHDGYLADMGKALLAHAEACRRAERKLTPAFHGNLTEQQLAKAERKSHG